MGSDLHKGKLSHLSVPVTQELEFHLQDKDYNHKCEVGKHYLVVVPSVCTSMDDGTTRFKQEGVLRVADNPGAEEKTLFKYLK